MKKKSREVRKYNTYCLLPSTYATDGMCKKKKKKRRGEIKELAFNFWHSATWPDKPTWLVVCAYSSTK